MRVKVREGHQTGVIPLIRLEGLESGDGCGWVRYQCAFYTFDQICCSCPGRRRGYLGFLGRRNQGFGLFLILVRQLPGLPAHLDLRGLNPRLPGTKLPAASPAAGLMADKRHGGRGVAHASDTHRTRLIRFITIKAGASDNVGGGGRRTGAAEGEGGREQRRARERSRLRART